MPLAQTALQRTQTGEQPGQQQQGQQQEYQPKLVYATRQSNIGDPVEMVFAVTNPQTGQEEIVTVRNIQAHELFQISQEGQQWLNQVYQSASRNIRRVA